jgi:hypothetical protein
MVLNKKLIKKQSKMARKRTSGKKTTKGVVVNNGTTKKGNEYVKIHTTKKAMQKHRRKINQRGGEAKVEKVPKGYKIRYMF